MEDILKSLKAYLYERSTSPLLGAVITSWCAWNYKFILIALSGERVTKKIKLIESYFDGHTLDLWGYSLSIAPIFTYAGLLPILTALSYIYLYPKVAIPVYRKSLKEKKNLRNIKQEDSDARILDEKESREIWQQISELQEKYDEDTTTLRSQISALSKNNKELKSQISTKKTPSISTQLSSRVASDEVHDDKTLEVLDYLLIRRNRSVSPTELAREKDLPLSSAYKSMKEMSTKGLIIEKRRDESGPQYSLTDKGHEVLVLSGMLDKKTEELVFEE